VNCMTTQNISQMNAQQLDDYDRALTVELNKITNQRGMVRRRQVELIGYSPWQMKGGKHGWRARWAQVVKESVE
jgi:hypothetical protein